MGGLCGGARPGYGASTGCCGGGGHAANPYGGAYGAQSTGCCGCGSPAPHPYPYPQYVQPVQQNLVASTVGIPVTEVIETTYTSPQPQFISAPAPTIISGPPAWQQNNLGPGTMISGPTIAGPPISIPSPHTINVGPPMGAPIGVGGFGGPIGGGFGGPIGGGFGAPIGGGFGAPIGGGFGGPIGGGFGGPIGGNFGRTSMITGGQVIGGPMIGAPIGGGFRPGFPGGAVTTTTTAGGFGGIGLPGAGIGLPGTYRY